MIRRVAMLSVHTSPLDAPGGGDAGGMNVYILETSRRLADAGIAVEVFTRATSSDQPPRVEAHPGVLVRHVAAGPFEGLCKEDLPAQLCAFAAAVLRAEARHEPGWYDVIHSHYWLSGQVGWLARDRWSVPLVHNAHTLGRVKNAALAEDDTPEPFSRIAGEQQVVAEADRLVASTEGEARDLIRWYGADPSRISVVPPGVDLVTFAPAPGARERLGIAPEDLVVTFVGRIQPLKAPDLVLRAAALLRDTDPDLGRRLRVLVLGAPSGTGLAHPDWLPDLAARLGLADRVVFAPPVDRATLADYYRASDLTIVPSYNESFGLVALESEACGTPVVAARVGGLPTSVADGVSGVLVDGHDPDHWAKVTGESHRRPPSRFRPSASTRPGCAPVRRGILLAAHHGWPTACVSARYRHVRDNAPRGGWRLTMDEQRVEVVEQALRDAGVEFERPGPEVFVAALPGDRRLKTACWLTVGEHALTVEAFVMRHPEENREQVYAYLLRHNARTYAVSWSIDDQGDVYLTGHVPLAAITPDELDRILGAVLEYADSAFNALLQLGFGSSIKREWRWRVKRGESLANLAAFADFAQRDDR